MYFIVAPNGRQLRALGDLVDAGALRPVVGPLFPLTEAAEAFTHQREQHVRGKVVLTVAGSGGSLGSR